MRLCPRRPTSPSTAWAKSREPALYLVGCGRRLCPPYSADVDRQKNLPSRVTPADPSRHVFREWPLTKDMIMTPRLNPFAAAPAPMKSWLDWSTGIQKSGLEDSLIELVKIRASQINGCARCLHMHTADARKHGETEEASLPARRLARIAALQRAGTRRACMDRSFDAGVRDPRARR